MSAYIILLNWTDQGIRNVKESPNRLDAARQLASTLGVELRDFYLTMGDYDMVAVVEADDDSAAARFALAIGSGGNVRSTSLKAFAETEYRDLIKSLP